MAASGCENPDKVVDRWRAKIKADLPVGTPSDAVEKYFKESEVGFTFESTEELEMTHALDVHPGEREQLTGIEFKGRYTAWIRDVGSDLGERYDIVVHVYVGPDGRVVLTRLRPSWLAP